MLHHIVVLGVDQQHGAQALDLGHQVVKMSRADHARLAGGGGRPDVGGEYLDAGEPVLHELMQRAEDVLGNLAQHHQVVGVVGVGVALPDPGALGDGLGNVNSGVLYGEVHQRRGAAEKRGATHLRRRSGGEIPVSHDGRGDMGVGFNAPRHNHLARCVNDAAGLVAHGARCCNRYDSFALHRHVPVSHSHGGNNLPASDNQVQHKKAPCLSLH